MCGKHDKCDSYQYKKVDKYREKEKQANIYTSKTENKYYVL